MKLRIEATDEVITSESGLVYIRKMLDKTHLNQRLNMLVLKRNGKAVVDPHQSNYNVLKSYVGLLSTAQNDFERIELYRKDKFFQYALDIDRVISSSSLRQRLNMAGEKSQWNETVFEENLKLLKKENVEFTAAIRDLIPLDIDVSPFDNSGTKKEGVSRTYAGYDGYAPIMAYFGKNEGWLVSLEMREGKRHSQCDKGEFIRKAIQRAKTLEKNILLRVDSGHDSLDTLKIALSEGVSFIIKRNLRKEDPKSYLERIRKDEKARIEKPREGKTVYRSKMKADVGLEKEVYIAYEVIERTIDKSGQILLVPDVEVKSYWTNLEDPIDTIIKLYQERGTSEQFHSEIKTDMGLTRFPSGKIKTNGVILVMAALAYNILRMMGQQAIKKKRFPIRHRKNSRFRLRTVIDKLMFIASKLVKHANQWSLKITRNNQFLDIFREIYYETETKLLC
ncbi:MAG: IS1380 family transposase [Chlorobi bacterium]|nr:IS1380 family transposase [Chlorobiota bacterium]